MFKIIHQSVEAKVEDFYEMYRKRCYATQTSYLELLNMFKKIIKTKKQEVTKSRRRLERGLKVLAMASIQVAELKEELTVK
jgi:dynein heavy chain